MAVDADVGSLARHQPQTHGYDFAIDFLIPHYSWERGGIVYGTCSLVGRRMVVGRGNCLSTFIAGIRAQPHVVRLVSEIWGLARSWFTGSVKIIMN